MEGKQKGAIAAAIAIATAIGGGSWALSLDFSETNTNIDDHSTNIGGDTNIFTQIKDELIDEATLAAICNLDEIPEEYTNTCKERESP